MADPTQEDLILQQFSSARKNLGLQKAQGQQDLEDQIARKNAISGLQGGAATKTLSKAENAYGKQYAGAQADLETNQAKALGDVAAQKAQQSFATSERLGSQDFAASEAQKQRAQSADQFAQTIGLQRDQFSASKDQFNQQMKYQWTEFSENQKTNMINAAVALWKSGLYDVGGVGPVGNIENAINSYSSKIKAIA